LNKFFFTVLPTVFWGYKMISIHKKNIIDKDGKPVEIIIPWGEFKDLEL